MRVLIAEDEANLNRLIKKVLEKEGMSVDAVFDGEEAYDFLSAADYDVAVLDITMPKMDGLAALKALRKEGNSTPVIFLTARDSIPDRVAGLDAGADDYLIKPFDFDELLARIRAITRKYSREKTSVLEVGGLTLDRASHRVKRDGKEITLSAREFALAEVFMQNKGIVLSRETLEEKLYSFDYEGGSNVIDVYVSFLRKKIDSDYSEKLIHTVRGRGWIMEERS